MCCNTGRQPLWLCVPYAGGRVRTCGDTLSLTVRWHTAFGHSLTKCWSTKSTKTASRTQGTGFSICMKIWLKAGLPGWSSPCGQSGTPGERPSMKPFEEKRVHRGGRQRWGMLFLSWCGCLLLAWVDLGFLHCSHVLLLCNHNTDASPVCFPACRSCSRRTPRGDFYGGTWWLQWRHPVASPAR